jgi:hypothetical protein
MECRTVKNRYNGTAGAKAPALPHTMDGHPVAGHDNTA